MKRIIFIIDQVYRHGGIERVLAIKANYLAELDNYEIHIITTEQKNNNKCYNFNKKIIFEDIQINYDRTKSYFHPINLVKLPKHIFKLKALFKKLNPDVVVVCSHSTDTYFIPFILKQIPKIKEYHYSKFIEENLRNDPKITFKKVFLKFADYVDKKYNRLIIVNETEASYYNTKNKIVIPNPLTFNSEKISDLDKQIVIAVGRIAPVKGYDQLIEIWKIVTKSNPKWKLFIFGDGEVSYIKYLQDLINQNNLNHCVQLKGSSNNIEKELLNSSIFVMTSHNECFPLVLLEAQACGLPIVSYDSPFGPRNIINKENGILIKLYDIQQFASELNLLMGNKSRMLEMGKNAKINAYKYKIDDVMNMWLKVFNNLK